MSSPQRAHRNPVARLFVRAAVADGAESLSAELEDGEHVAFALSLSPREREMLLAGGLLELIRQGGLELASGLAPASA